jgi:Ca2+-binding EF-hand superfamily protein
MPVIAAASLCAVVALSIPAAAQQPGQMMQGQTPGQMMQGAPAEQRESRRERRMQRWTERRLSIFDTNKDGKVFLAEIAAEERRLFTAADVNGDGKLSAEEFSRRGRWFIRLRAMSFLDMLDVNGDGEVSLDELNKPSERWFKRYDANKSGALEAGELANTQQHRGRRRFVRH